MVSTNMNGHPSAPPIRLAVIVLGFLLTPFANATDQPAMTPIGSARGSVSPKVTTTGPLQLKVMDAILLGLEKNRSLRVERLEPAITRTFENQENALFDPVLTGGISGQKFTAEEETSAGGGLKKVETKTVDGSAHLSRFFATGATVSIDGTTRFSESSTDRGPLDETRAGVSITQSLLKGAGTAVNVANLRQARIDTLSTEYQLRGFAEMLVARIENTYWDYTLSQRRIEIYQESLRLAEQQLAETRERIAVGKMAALDLSAAAAEVASRQADLINARGLLEKMRIQLVNLVNPGGTNAFKRDFLLLDQPRMPQAELDDVSTHVAVAMRMRSDLNETRLGIERGDLDVVKTRNGLLPRLDLFITLGSSGYADSFRRSSRNVNGDFYDAAAGLEFAFPIGNADAKAQHLRANLKRDQASEILANMRQLAEVDVRSAYVEIGRAREEVAATALLVKLREETVRSETEKFRVGRSTTLLVAQTHRELLISQIQQIEAIVNYQKSIVSLYLSEGSLLERRGISAPGHGPVSN